MTTLALVELLDRDGQVRHGVAVTQWPVRLGRAIDCDVVIDDPHVAAHHATLSETAGGALQLQAGDETRNGVHLARGLLRAGEGAELGPGEVWQLGHTRVRVRRAGEVLAPERPLAPEPWRGGWAALLPLAGALLVWMLAEQWLGNEPGSRLIDYLPALLGVPVLLALWAGLWGLGAKLFRHRFEFWPHLRVVLSFLLAIAVLDAALPVLAYALSWEFLARVRGFVRGALLCAMFATHLSLVLPARRRWLQGAVAVSFVVGTALTLARNVQSSERYFEPLYLSTLPPPALRLAPAVSVEQFLGEAKKLRAKLDAHARDGDSGNNGGESLED